MGILVQCDFDGTILMDNLGDKLLRVYANEAWQRISAEYRAERIPLESYNRQAFSHVKESRATLQRFTSENAEMRPHFPELVRYCREHGLEFVIVSNGLDFYIEASLGKFGLRGLRYFSGKADFTPSGIQVRYPSPDGTEALQIGFKAAYVDFFRQKGYKVIYIGDGLSDRIPAGKASYAFARGSLLDHCQRDGVPHSPFNDFRDVIRGLKSLDL